MSINIVNVSPNPEPTVEISCANCEACCCRLEVMILTDTGVPNAHIRVDEYGGETMNRLHDGWCSALDRGTMMCTIYENRPWVCRIFEMASPECIEEREEHL
jgi:Fe-S-cluster containining protein